MGLPRWEWQVPRKAHNKASGEAWAAHASQERGGKGLKPAKLFIAHPTYPNNPAYHWYQFSSAQAVGLPLRTA